LRLDPGHGSPWSALLVKAMLLCPQSKTGILGWRIIGLLFAGALGAAAASDKVILQLSYTRNAIASQGMVEEGMPVIQKPFSTTELADRVRAVLDR
jgi:hypothetical protein